MTGADKGLTTLKHPFKTSFHAWNNKVNLGLLRLVVKTANSWNRSSEIPRCQNTLVSRSPPTFPMFCYRIIFFHLKWTPRVQSKQSDMVQLARLLFLSPLILLAWPKPSTAGQKKHGIDILAALEICSTTSGGQPKTFLPSRPYRVQR